MRGLGLSLRTIIESVQTCIEKVEILGDLITIGIIKEPSFSLCGTKKGGEGVFRRPEGYANSQYVARSAKLALLPSNGLDMLDHP